MTSKRKWGRAIGSLMAVTLASAGLLVALAPAANAAPTGASAEKDCPTAVPPAFYTIGSVVTCTATFTNTGASSATVDAETEQAPWISNGNPSNGPITNISCVTAANQTIGQLGTLPPNTACTATFNVTIPNDPALCNTFFRDRVEIDLEYPSTGNPPLTADAGATNTFAVVCPPKIAVTKTATPLSKPTDPVTYNIQVCNTGLITVTKSSVVDSLLGDISADFPATLAPGACASDTLTRTVLASDPNPLVNTVTATYTGAGMTDTETASAHTDLFYPSVAVTKSCGPNPIEVGSNELCQIVVTNTSTGTTPPALNPASISDSLNGDLLTPGNPAVVSTTCGAPLATGASCTINTTRTVLASDPTPLVNTVSVLYHPNGFPNNITANASANVDIVNPAISLTLAATPLSKPTDPVTYTITLCDTGNESVTRSSVLSAILGDETALFPTTLTAGQCVTVTVQRTVLASDPNPLVVSLTANYSGIVKTVTASSTASTDLFFPSVGVTKTCGPNPITVGTNEVCTINVTNTSTGTTPPALVNGTINDTLSGDLLAAGNPAVTASTCTTTLATGASCQITTSRTVLASDPNPLVNTVSVHYNPDGFPNNITGSATATVNIQTTVTQQCTLGFWKQAQHFHFWVGFTPNQKFSAVFGVTITLKANGSTPAITDPTLLQALNAGGGGINSLARHAVAALLNSSSLQSPTYTTAQVISMVQTAIAGGPSAIQALADKLDAEQQADNCTGFINS